MYLVDFTKVRKKLHQIPEYIVLKLYRWADGVEKDGLEEMRKIPGFHDEPLKGSHEGSRSIRLNRAYRAIYNIKDSKSLTIVYIQEVNKHEY